MKLTRAQRQLTNALWEEHPATARYVKGMYSVLAGTLRFRGGLP